MNTENYNEVQQDLFVEEDLLNLQEANAGRRFANMLIDSIAVNYTINLLTGFVIAYVLYQLAPDTAYSVFVERDFSVYLVFLYLTAFLNSFIYYTICEKVFKGQTLGKLITGTKAVRYDGTDLTWRDAALRSVIRYVPFEALSIWFGNGLWHDTWSKTMVVRKR